MNQDSPNPATNRASRNGEGAPDPAAIRAGRSEGRASNPAAILASLRRGLVVSCQAYPGEPLRDPDTMRRMAEAVLAGGAVGIRAQGLADLEAIRRCCAVPLIGLWKLGDAPVRITPTVESAVAVAATGADIVAVDGTGRPRPDGRQLAESIAAVHAAGRLVMADVATLAEGIRAAELGADVVGTTLSGYTEDSPAGEGPDLDLVGALAARLDIPVVAEGRIQDPGQAAAALERGAYAVVVGTAITHPTTLTRRFVAGLQ